MGVTIFGFCLIWMYGVRRMAERQGFGGLMAIGKSRAKIYVETDTKVAFRDVAGVDEAKSELHEIVAFLRDPKSFGRLGARIPKGVLLIGPPGSGKTLLARGRRRGGRISWSFWRTKAYLRLSLHCCRTPRRHGVRTAIASSSQGRK
jgi:hypothetical protein